MEFLFFLTLRQVTVDVEHFW